MEWKGNVCTVVESRRGGSCYALDGNAKERTATEIRTILMREKMNRSGLANGTKLNTTKWISDENKNRGIGSER